MRDQANPYAQKRARNDSRDDHNSSSSNFGRPSMVVQVRNLDPQTMGGDLFDALSPFGTIAYVKCCECQMGLVEFEELNSAIRCVQYTSENPICVAGRPVHIDYSTSESIGRSNMESAAPNKILLLSVTNTRYAVDVDVIRKICSPPRRPLRISIEQNGDLVRALVEFDIVEAAMATKRALNGADIYANCCHLKVEFAKANKVWVKGSDAHNWEMPKTGDPRGDNAMQLVPSLYPPPSIQLARHSYGDGGGGYFQQSTPASNFPQYTPIHNNSHSGGGGSVSFGSKRGVFIRGTNPKNFNCEKVFNLLSPYGNCLKVNFGRDAQHTCMAEMDSEQSAANVIKYLNGCKAFGQALAFFQQDHLISGVNSPSQLLDGSPSFVDFTASRNHRFSNPERAARNRLNFPSAQLYWFNAPPKISEEKIAEIFEARGMRRPSKVLVFPQRSERGSVGLVEFDSVEEATEALIVCNNSPIQNEGTHPYFVKFSFSNRSDAAQSRKSNRRSQ